MPHLPRKLLCLTLGSVQDPRWDASLLQGWLVQIVASTEEAEAAMQSQSFVVGLLLLCTPHTDAMHDVNDFLERATPMPWVLLVSMEVLAHDACKALILKHFCDYHTFPVDVSRLAFALGHAVGYAQLQQQVKSPLLNADSMGLIGHSPAMQCLRQQIRKVALVDAPVLISGESGSGKELTARAVHQYSSRCRGPFVAVNCGAIPTGLVQSELFGHERGAFTGAVKERRGWIESADHGTLFLDEIADLPLEQQVNLLRFLQEGTILRVGASKPLRVDVRVVAASHQHLEDAVRQGRFREDLMYRLNVLPLHVPALRERKEDMELLLQHFFQTFAHEKNKRLTGWSAATLRALKAYDWPGNVRELMNRIRRAMVMAEGRLLMPHDLGLPAIAPQVPVAHAPQLGAEALSQVRTRAEQEVILQTWHSRGKNISHAARDLGISRMTLYRLLDKHRLRA